MVAARPRVRVHVVATDDDHRVLLDRRPRTQLWALPWAYLSVAEDPARIARGLIHDTGAAPAMPRVLGIDSAVEHGEHFLDITFHCSADRIWKPKAVPASSNALWWSLDEISSLELTARAKSALVNSWNVLWPRV